jgi:hypothetical protein
MTMAFRRAVNLRPSDRRSWLEKRIAWHQLHLRIGRTIPYYLGDNAIMDMIEAVERDNGRDDE